VTSATLARGADGGAAVGLVLLAMMPAAHVARPSLVGGLLATCLTAPHLFGPVLARQLDRADDGRWLLAGAFSLYGLALVAASLLVGHAPVMVAAALVIIAGACGPLLTGGLSSRLSELVGAGERAQRRAQGWDSVSYGIGGSAGPAVVAALAAVANPRLSMAMLSCAAVLAAALVLTLPASGGLNIPADEVLPVRQTLRLIAFSGPLRRVTYATMIAALPGGALAVLAVALGRHLGAGGGAGAVLAATFGLGNFLGSLLVTAFPLTGEPEKLASRYAAGMGAAFGLCALVPNVPVGIVVFALAGAMNAPFFTATLASRVNYSPPGARAQVFVSMAALKIAVAALGTTLAGLLLGIGPRALLLMGALLTIAAAAATVIDRRLDPPPEPEPDYHEPLTVERRRRPAAGTSPGHRQ
jgi:MFS family permease